LQRSANDTAFAWRSGRQGLRESDVIAFVVPPEQALRPNVLFELGVAVGMGKPAIPVVPREADAARLPFPLRGRRVIRKGEPEETARRFPEQTAVVVTTEQGGNERS
jgi:hypothetical protein